MKFKEFLYVSKFRNCIVSMDIMKFICYKDFELTFEYMQSIRLFDEIYLDEIN